MCGGWIAITIRDEAEHLQDRAAILSKLAGADSLFHHVEQDVQGWTRHHHRQIGSLGILSKDGIGRIGPSSPHAGCWRTA